MKTAWHFTKLFCHAPCGDMALVCKTPPKRPLAKAGERVFADCKAPHTSSVRGVSALFYLCFETVKNGS